MRCRHHVSANDSFFRGARCSRAPNPLDRCSECAQLMFSNAFVRENDTAEIVATMRKMMIETALARP